MESWLFFTIFYAISIGVTEAAQCAPVGPPGQCQCYKDQTEWHRGEWSMDCKNLIDAPVIPSYILQVSFDESNLPRLSANVFKNAQKLWALTISNCKLLFIDDDAFDNLISLKTLNLNSNRLSSIPVAVTHLPVLEHLNLDYNNITSLGVNGIFATNKSLYLQVASNKISAINSNDAESFKNLASLSLDMSRTSLNNVSKWAFNIVNKIYSFDISNTVIGLMPEALQYFFYSIRNTSIKELLMMRLYLHLDTLDTSIFKSLNSTGLEVLLLEYNYIHTIKNNAFDNISQLSELYMSNCRIRVIEKEAFLILTKLTYIDISDNLIGSWQILVHILTDCPYLKVLKASNAQFEDIDTQKLPAHTNLTSLELSSNTFTSICDFRKFVLLRLLVLNSISNLFSLNRLQISGMQYLKFVYLGENTAFLMKKSISRKVFKDLPSLQRLNLVYNRLDLPLSDESSTIAYLFRGLKNLIELDIGSNKLRLLKENTFKDLKNLHVLRLDENLLASLPINLFQHLTEIKEINLESNLLTNLLPEHFQNLNKLASLKLTENQFACTCALRPFVAWMPNYKNIIPNYNSLICVSPDVYRSVPIITYKPLWISCDNHGWMMAGLGVAFLMTSLMSFLTVYYFRWDIRFWFAVRRTRARLGKEVAGDDEPDERTSLMEDQGDYHAFASYCSKDSDWVRQELVENLEEAGEMRFQLCIDERDFLPGLTILNNISLKMSQSKKVIFVVSRSFIKSRWCNFEVDIAQTKILDENSGMIIIIFLENIPKRELPRSLRRICNHVTHITWDNRPRKQEIFWKRLKLALNA